MLTIPGGTNLSRITILSLLASKLPFIPCLTCQKTNQQLTHLLCQFNSLSAFMQPSTTVRKRKGKKLKWISKLLSNNFDQIKLLENYHYLNMISKKLT